MRSAASHFRVSHQGRIELWTLGDGHRNTLTTALIEAMAARVEALRGQPDLRAVVVTGAGERTFVAGADLNERSEMDRQQVLGFLDSLGALFRSMESGPQFFVSALNGATLGGGLELALSTDVRWATSEAKLGLPEVGLAIIPGAGGTQRLPRLVGFGHGKNLILTGRTISADEAHGLGLVDQVLGRQELLPAAIHYAQQVASSGAEAFSAALRGARERKLRCCAGEGAGPSMGKLEGSPVWARVKPMGSIAEVTVTTEASMRVRPLAEVLAEIGAAIDVRVVVLASDWDRAQSSAQPRSSDLAGIEACDKPFVAMRNGGPFDVLFARHADIRTELRTHALQVASELSIKGPCALQAAKAALRDGCPLSLEEGLRLERSLYQSRVLDTEDRLEGLKAFLEKRVPQYRGR